MDSLTLSRLLADPPLAGEAFCVITGLRLEGPYVLPRMEEEAALPPTGGGS
jgi:hypothetical protein